MTGDRTSSKGSPGGLLTAAPRSGLSGSGGWPFGLYAQRPYYSSAGYNYEVRAVKDRLFLPAMQATRVPRAELQQVLTSWRVERELEWATR